MILYIYSINKQFEIHTDKSQTFAQAIWLSGELPSVPLCGSLGLCGRCKGRFLENAPEPTENEKKYFSEQELTAGWRLTCNHVPDAPITKIELPDIDFRNHSGNSEDSPKDLCKTVLGIDLGTTSIEWREIAITTNRIINSGKMLNPQGAAGADVISRLCFAHSKEHLAMLSSIAMNAIKNFISSRVQRMCIAANSAMTEILLNKDISGLCAAPYSLPYHGNEIISINNIETIIPPLPAPFIGGDISCGLLDLIELKTPRPFLLADLGTNAELALVMPDDRVFMASAPLGPAMEGIGPQCGQPAGDNVITSFQLQPEGLKARFYNNQTTQTPTGISATGYLSALTWLLKSGIISRDGHFVDVNKLAMPISRKIASQISEYNGIKRLYLCGDLFISAEDMEILLKTKAAFSSAAKILLSYANISFKDLAVFCLAGAISEYANSEDLKTLGFAPTSTKILLCGNTSLAGACLLAIQPEKLAEISRLCQNAHIVQLTADKDYMGKYLAAMQWEPLN